MITNITNHLFSREDPSSLLFIRYLNIS